MIARMFIRELFERMVADVVDRIMVINRGAATLRRWSVILIGGTIWAFIAFREHPFVYNQDIPLGFLVYPFRALFAADVFKHVLISAVVFWLAYRTAAVYLDDIFELNNVRVAERFIRQSAFGSRYDLIEIMDGKVADKYKNSPIYLIGGPGKVRVYLENAALFEKIDGQPHVIGPTVPKTSQEALAEHSTGASGILKWIKRIYFLLTGEGDGESPGSDGTVLLEGFESLRSIIDLRDQVETMTVISRTRDGILIRAEDLRVVFSIYRDNQFSTLVKPYPFSPEAFETLVYTMPRVAFIPNISHQINRWLGRFISRHTLSEFLAAIESPEIQEYAGEATQEAAQVTGAETAGGNGTYNQRLANMPPFKSRPEIRELFYDYNDFVKKAQEKGVELRWIGLGNWVLPNSIIPEKHLRAWRLTQENLIRGSQAALDSVRVESKVARLPGIIRVCPLGRVLDLDLRDEVHWKNNMAHLTNGYIGKLEEALDIYGFRQQADSPEAQRIEKLKQHLSRVAGGYIS